MTIGICCFLYILSLGGIYAIERGMFGELPTQDELQAITVPVASKVYSVDGELIGQYFFQERTPIDYEAIPKHLIDALVATEDARFYKHDGLDGQSLLRVLFKTVLLQDESSGGGSTITQQLAKNLVSQTRLWHLQPAD